MKLKPEFVDKYKECHARVWPEVLKQIKDCNIEDCRLLFSFSLDLHSHCLSQLDTRHLDGVLFKVVFIYWNLITD